MDMTQQASPQITLPVGASMPPGMMTTWGPESLYSANQTASVVREVAPVSAPQTDWFSGLTSMVSPLLSLYQQKKLTDINAQRAAQGLPPIDAAGAGLAAQAQVGLDEGTKKILMYGIGAATLVGLAIAFRPRAR